MITGSISAQYESRGKPYQVPPATGEQSYGTFQFLGDTPKGGGDPTVVKFLERSGYKNKFAQLKLNSAEFKKKWQELGKTDPLFEAAQYQYVAKTHFYPLASYVEKKGLPRSKAIDEALFSMSVQHGKAREVCDMAITKLDLKTATEEQIVNALYDARAQYVEGLIKKGIGREADLKALLSKRYPAERVSVLGLVDNTRGAPPSFKAVFEQLGLSGNEAENAAADASGQAKYDPEALQKKLLELQAWYQKNQVPASTVGEPLDHGVDDPDEMVTAPEVNPSIPVVAVPPSEELEKLHEEERKGVVEFLDFLGEVAERTHIKGLAQTVGIAKGCMEAYKAVNQFANLSGSILAALDPISALGGAVLGIISLFGGSGPSATEIILDQLQHLSEQMANLKDYMTAQFEELFRQNQEILNAVHHGLFAVTLEVQSQIGGMRVELNARLDKISAGIKYLAQKTDLDTIQLALEGLRECYGSVKDLTESNTPDIEGEPTILIPRLSGNLWRWATIESVGALYTGLNKYVAAPPPDVFVGTGSPPLDMTKSILLGEHGDEYLKESTLSCSLIGYLARYYNHYRDPALEERIPETTVPNPQLWHDVAQKYFTLKVATFKKGDVVESFLQYDKDPRDTQLDSIKEAGRTFIRLITAIEGDAVFWNALFHRYNALIEKLSNAYENYIQAYTDTIRHDLNEKDKALPYDMPPVVQWSFLNDPEYLIAAMKTRTLRQVNGFQNKIGAGIHAMGEALKNNVFLHLLPEVILAVDYLAIPGIYFSVYQTAAIPMPSIINPISGSDFVEVDAKLTARGDKQGYGYVEAKVGMEVFRKSAGSSERVVEWRFPAEISVNFNWITPTISLAQFELYGSYDQLEVRSGFSFSPGDTHSISHGGEVFVSDPKYWEPANAHGSYGYDLLAAIPGYVKHILDETTHFNFANGHSLPTADAEAKATATELVDTYFLNHRKEIIRILNASEEPWGGFNSEERIKQHRLYRDTLTELDIHVQLMRLFFYLTEKDLNAAFFQTLITSTAEDQRLKDYEQNATITTPFLWIPSRRASAEALDLPGLDSLQMAALGHPKHLFEEIVSADEACRKSKIIFKKLHPAMETTATARLVTGSLPFSESLAVASAEESVVEAGHLNVVTAFMPTSMEDTSKTNKKKTAEAVTEDDLSAV